MLLNGTTSVGFDSTLGMLMTFGVGNASLRMGWVLALIQIQMMVLMILLLIHLLVLDLHGGLVVTGLIHQLVQTTI